MREPRLVVLAAALAGTLLAAPFARSQPSPPREIAVTIDDLPLNGPDLPLPAARVGDAYALNADVLDRWATALKIRGYAFVTLERALADPAYGTADPYVSRNGISWLHRWLFAKTGATMLTNEPDPPSFVRDAYAAIQKRRAAR